MAADVTSILRIMEEAKGKRRGLFTRDLLSGAAAAGDLGSSKELDLELQVPIGWERRLDLMSGKTYLHRLDSDLSCCGPNDLNLPPPSASVGLPEDSELLELKLAGGCGGGIGGIWGEYQSVCTLEKVKLALERAGRQATASASDSPSSSTTTSSMKRPASVAVEDEDGGWDSAGAMMAAACPGCLLYVLISKGNPRCPGCDSHVPVAFMPRKPRFDLNSS